MIVYQQGFETDGVPPPSDFELEAMDRNHETTISFNQFIAIAAKQHVGINSEREAFWHFANPGDIATDRSERHWWACWARFCQQQDARDEHETMLDVRYAGTP